MHANPKKEKKWRKKEEQLKKAQKGGFLSKMIISPYTWCRVKTRDQEFSEMTQIQQHGQEIIIFIFFLHLFEGSGVEPSLGLLPTLLQH